jgi:hypothetical protein
MIDQLIQSSLKYIHENISIIATDNNKTALMPWAKYQKEIISEAEIRKQLTHPKAAGLAVICGAVSGNLEVIDIDLKNDTTNSIYDTLCGNIPKELFEKLYIVQTKSGGYHFYYRCKTIERNQKLAERYPTDQEKKDNPHLKQIALIETRAEGGYVCAPPTEGYKYISGTLQEITIEERDTLLSNCRLFNEVIIEQPAYLKSSYGSSGEYLEKPWDHYNKSCPTDEIISLLGENGWKKLKATNERIYFTRPGKSDGISGDYHTELRLFKVFTTSSQFEPGKGYRPFSLLLELKFNKDIKKAVEYISEKGYGEKHTRIDKRLKKSIRKMIDLGTSEEKIAAKLATENGISQEEAADLLRDYKNQSGKRIMTFWDVDENGKISIMRDKLLSFLYHQGGYSLYFFNPGSTIYKIVRCQDGFIEEASTQSIKEFIESYIESLEPLEPFDFGTTSQALKEVIKRGSSTYFSKDLLEFLKRGKLTFLKDDKDTAYFPFKNSVVKITNDSITLKSYGEIDKVIWKSEVVDHNIIIDENPDFSLCEFNRFIGLICSNDQDKINFCHTMIGYLIHKYKDPSRPWCFVFGEETESDEQGGGTGKGIMVKALSFLVNTQRLDGKNFKPDKNFAFQRITLDTKLMAIEDVRRNFDFEAYYTVIADGMTIEKKNKDELYMSDKDSPKIIISTNYTISSTGQHAKRRQKVFEFANYFNAKYTPYDEFKHLLFDGWDKDEWNRFYNFMFYCCRLYLQAGLLEVGASEKIKRKHINTHFTEDFLDYFDDLIKHRSGQWNGISNEYQGFIDMNNIDKKDYSIKRFKKGLKVAIDIFGYKIEERRNSMMNKQIEIFIHPPEGFGSIVSNSNMDELEYEI